MSADQAKDADQAKVPEGLVIALRAGDAVVTVYPDSGGRIGQIAIGDVDLLIDVPTPDARRTIRWGCYPMAPWAGRLRHGRFTFGGTDQQLTINHHDGDPDDRERSHSIHGNVWERPWTVRDVAATTATLECPLNGGLDWSLGGIVVHELELHADRLVQTLTVAATDEHVDADPFRAESFPAEVGWHPWFRKPDRLTFNPTLMYRRDGLGIPTGELVDVTDGPWDDCFVNTEPVRLHYDRAIAHTVTVLSDCDDWVVFDQTVAATCVEPQSGPPNAFNMVHHIVGPGSPLRRTMTIAW